MLPFLRRLRKPKTRSQSSEPRVVATGSVVSVISDEISFPPRGSSAYNEVHLPKDRSLGKSHESTIATDLFLAGI